MSENQISNVEFAQVFSERVSNLLRESNKPQKCDLIDRQAAIATAVKAAIDWHRLANPQYSIAYCIGEAMRALPSVQPETAKRTAKSAHYVSNDDLISRKSVIEVLDRTQWLIPDAKNVLKDHVRILPSAQPEKMQLSREDATFDCISRQSAIAEFSCCELTPDGGIDANYAIDFLEQMPSVQPEPKWIPCSERLPEAGTEVFVYLFDSPSPYIAWIEDTHWYTEDFEVDREDEPIAWMPLPEPYKGEQE